MTDIESYTYLNHELENLPFKKDPMALEEENMHYLEDILLIKGWRRYTWPDLLLTKADDTLSNISSVVFKGRVARQTKPLKKPMELTTISEQGIGTIQTDSTGNFEVQKEQLIFSPGKKLYIYPPKKEETNSQIAIKDPYHELSKMQASILDYPSYDVGVTEKNTDSLVLKKGERAEALPEVIVKSSKKDNFFSYQKNECGDYICQYHVLNCPNHPFGGTLPVVGNRYKIAYGGEIVYAGCAPQINHHTFIEGIYTAKEFYQIDYTKLNSLEQSYTSTLYWNYSVAIGSDKPQELSFYTSDIPGKFKVIVQGVTTEGVVLGEYIFNVLKDKIVAN
jgi:hypothetical protein